MIKYLTTAIIILGFTASAGASSIVPPDEQVSDRETRLTLARLFVWENRLDEADTYYASQLRVDPHDQLIFLERQYKWHLRHGRYLEGYDNVHDLLTLEPGNPEARFDRSQLFCSLGLHEAERSDYVFLLNENPHHIQVQECQKALQRRSLPRLSAKYSLWDEEGRDRLIGMRTQTTDVSVDKMTSNGRAWARIGRRQWKFTPDEGNSDDADGMFADARFVLSPAVTFEGSASLRDFSNTTTPDKGVTATALLIRLRQAAQLRLSISRYDEIVNRFSLATAMQVRSREASLILRPANRFELNLSYANLSWDDDNDGTRADLSLAYELRPHPEQARLIYRLSMRDTDEESQWIYTGDALTDIIHPYWTPQDWREHALTIEFRKDLVPWKIRGTGTNEIGLALTGATDNESNDSVRVEAWWLKDLRDSWSVAFRTIFHASDYWDARGATISVGRRF